MAKLVWKGREVANKVRRAAALGIDKTMSEAVTEARRNHPWVNRTGFEEAAVDMKPAIIEGERTVGKWGGYANYSLFLEIGTSRIGPDARARELEGGGNMWAIPGPLPPEGVTVRQEFTILPPGSMDGQEDFVTLHRPSMGEGPLMHARPFLRPAADMQYPMLAARIGAAFRGDPLP